MNILQILPRLESGGVETGTIDLARELIKQNHKAVVISCGGSLVSKLQETGARHYALAVHKKSLISVLRLIPKVARIIKKERIDIVHARSRVPAWIAFFAVKLSPAIFITTCHGYYQNHYLSRVMGWGRYAIVISQVIGCHMIDDFKVAKDKIRLIYRGVDTERFKSRDYFIKEEGQVKTIAIIGRISPLKGHVHFIKALPQIISEVPDLKVLVVGAATKDKQAYFKQLMELVRQCGLKERVEFLGNVSDVPGILEKLDVLVMATTTQEAFGRVIIEAGAVGVPVVATSVGGVLEIIEHEKDGLLAEPENPYELAKAVVRMIKDRQLAKTCAQNLAQKVKDKFSLDTLVKKTIDVYEQAIYKKRILVFKFGALGDIVLISPSLRALREKFPKAEIQVIVKDKFKDVLQKCPYIDNLIILKNNGLIEIWKKIRQLRKQGFDFSIDLQNNRLTHVMGFMAGIKERFGYKDRKFGFLLNRGILDKNKQLDPVPHQFQVLKPLGISFDNGDLEMWVGERYTEHAHEFLQTNWYNDKQRLIGINACASPRWKSKLWPIESYARICDMLAQRLNARILFTGTQHDRAYIERIIAKTSCKPINAAGKTQLLELAALIKRCRVFLTTDSAPMHIAAAVGTAFVALFGPTDPKRHLPKASNFDLINKQVDCAPCYRSHCFRNSCMKKITVDEVFNALLALIKKEEGEDKLNENTVSNHTS